MSMKLVRIPQAVRRMHPEVVKEIRTAYDTLGKAAIGTLAEDVADWSDKPTFKYIVKVTKKGWSMEIKYDKRTIGGKHYTWVDKGTGSYVEGGEPYIIEPKNPGGMLRFKLPSMTKTLAASGIPSKSSQAPPGSVSTNAVLHPGIDPRQFSQELVKHLKSRKSGSFRNVTEAAIKRAFRRLGIHT